MVMSSRRKSNGRGRFPAPRLFNVTQSDAGGGWFRRWISGAEDVKNWWKSWIELKLNTIFFSVRVVIFHIYRLLKEKLCGKCVLFVI